MASKLKKQSNFKPLPVDDGDECFPNGIFEFNITKMLDFINQSDSIQPEPVKVADFWHSGKNANEDHLPTVDLTKPIIIAEIAPDRYNIIDGNHRVEKAKRENIETLPAYRIKANDHVRFLTSQKSYLCYVDYWNDKVTEIRKHKEMMK